MNGDHDYWQQLETAMRARNVPTFVTLVVNSLQEKKLQFKQLQQGLVTHCINKVGLRPVQGPMNINLMCSIPDMLSAGSP